MRGKQRGVTCIKIFRGITPAHAGKTIQHFPQFFALRDHPRACGENRRARRFSMVASGSPPRMRGKLDDIIAGPDLGRITPAHAGKTRG